MAPIALLNALVKLLVLNLCWYGPHLLGWITKKIAEPPLESLKKTFPKCSFAPFFAECPAVENCFGGAPAVLATKTLTTGLLLSPFS